MPIAPKIHETELSAAEVLGLHTHLHLQLSRTAYRVSRWIEPGSGLDWANAEKDSREEMERVRAELVAAGYLDESGDITVACGDYTEA